MLLFLVMGKSNFGITQNFLIMLKLKEIQLMRKESDWILRDWQRTVFQNCVLHKTILFLFQLLNFFEIVSVFHLFSCGQCNNPTLKKLHNWLLRKNSNWLDLKHLIYIFNQKNLRFSERFGLGTITNESVSYLDVST